MKSAYEPSPVLEKFAAFTIRDVRALNPTNGVLI
jgi:hypothetical protein